VLDWTVVLYQYESSDFIFCGEVDPHFGISQAYQGVAWQLFPARLVPITIRRFIDSSGSAPGADISSYVVAFCVAKTSQGNPCRISWASEGRDGWPFRCWLLRVCSLFRQRSLITRHGSKGRFRATQLLHMQGVCCTALITVTFIDYNQL
jgi:hypothetical protein